MNHRTKSKICVWVILILILTILASCDQKNINNDEIEKINKEASGTSQTEESTNAWTEDTDPNINLEIIELNTSQFITWPDIYEDYVVFANYNINVAEKRQIHLFNTYTKEDKVIYSGQDSKIDYVIDDTRIGDGWVFWVEGYWSTLKNNRDWFIKAYNIEEKRIKTVRSFSDLPGTSTLQPRVENEDNTIVWLEGYLDSDNVLKHVIYSYNADCDEIKKIADVSHVENPYTIIKPRNYTICFSDYMDDKWMMRIINLKTMDETSITLDEYPKQPCSDGRIAVWKENVRELRYMDLNTMEKDIVPINPFLFDIYNGCIFTSVSDDKKHIYKFDITNKVVTCITRNAESEHEEIYFRFTNYHGDKMVCTFQRTLKDENNQTIGLKYDLVIADGIFEK